jgi:hypothetical protein
MINNKKLDQKYTKAFKLKKIQMDCTTKMKNKEFQTMTHQ